MKSILVIGLSILFVLAIAAYAVWRGFKKQSGDSCGCGCSCSGDEKSKSSCGIGQK